MKFAVSSGSETGGNHQPADKVIPIDWQPGKEWDCEVESGSSPKIQRPEPEPNAERKPASYEARPAFYID
jgi:hypothetical protein